LPHEANYTLPFWHFQNSSNLWNRVTTKNLAVSILPSTTKTLLELYCH